ncbi:MAG TPA: SLBB domain-containing protein [Flavipsychrobacter sp.]|nr:SLBB domain-containing protein [Flavipsychrobacter sp.]
MLFFIAYPASGQKINQQDFTNVRVDEMSDAQIRTFMKQIESSGLGEEQLEQIASAKGMNQTEIAKLRQRVERIKKQDSSNPRKSSETSRTVNKPQREEEKQEQNNEYREEDLTETQRQLRARIFGSSLFANSNLTFEPNLRLATPVDYQIGPDDELLIDIYGYSEASYQLRVSPEGTINIPMIGVVPVSGATMEQASSRIRTRLSKIYTGIANGSTSVSISLGNIRSIRVVLTGDVVKPGTYTLPSVATVFNALYASGGPTQNGSFRTIQIIRGGSIIASLDVYDFLLYGSLKNNIRLQDQDVIRIPTYRTRVEISGQVKRDGVFEMMSGESLADLLRFAGDFNERAYKARIKVLKNTETERRIEDIQAPDFSTYQPSSGDQFFVEEILDRFQNRVRINGAVFRPGEFELTEGLTLSQLIGKAEGLKEDAFANRGYITRIKSDLTSEIISFSTADVLSGRTDDVALRREDVITIPSIFELREEYKLSIDGEVRNPGTFAYAENTTLEELIIKSGGLRESAMPKRVEIARRVRSTKALSDTSVTAQVFYVDIDRDMKLASSFVLQPFDIVSVRPAPGYQVQKQVRIEGEVLYPGNYTITNKNERISDLIKRAGGLTVFAYKEGASLKRTGKKLTQSDVEQEQYKLQQFQSLQKANNDSADLNLTDASIRNDYVGINLPRILKNAKADYDLILEDGDVINIPKELQTVKVSGEVLSPSSVLFSGAKSFKKYIRESGGFAPRALKKRSYVIYANGGVASTRKFFIFNSYPNVKPGSEIFVPQKEERKSQLSTPEIVSISTGLATIATLIFTVFR